METKEIVSIRLQYDNEVGVRVERDISTEAAFETIVLLLDQLIRYGKPDELIVRYSRIVFGEDGMIDAE